MKRKNNIKWSRGKEADVFSNLLAHFKKHADNLRIKTLRDYYDRANDLTEKAEYSWVSGNDTVFFHSATAEVVYVNRKGEIKSFYRITDKKKLEKYMKKIKELTNRN